MIDTLMALQRLFKANPVGGARLLRSVLDQPDLFNLSPNIITTLLRKCAHVITNMVNKTPVPEEGEEPGMEFKFDLKFLKNA